MSFATCGPYDPAIASLVQSLGWEVVLPPPVTAETLELGVRYAPEMICFPYKVTLGSILQVARSGVGHVLTYNTQGDCRYSHFPTLYRDILRKLGVDCVVHTVDAGHLVRSFRSCAAASFSWMGLGRGLWAAYGRMMEIEAEERLRFSSAPLKVMVVGEAWTTSVPQVNGAFRERLLSAGVGTEIPARFSFYIRERYLGARRSEAERETEKVLAAPIGGCARESITNTILACKGGYHGIVHVYPLTCMPETTIMGLLDSIAEEHGLPLLHLEIEENISRLNVQNRIEAFAEIVTMKAGHG